MATTLSMNTQLLDNALKIGGFMFDYWLLGKELSVPENIIQELEEEARNEFPYDGMLAEIHILRAVKAYAKANTGRVAVEG